MDSGLIDNRATEVPFAGILAALLTENLRQRPEKAAAFRRMRGSVAIVLADIEAEVTLDFAGGRAVIEAGIIGRPELVIQTAAETVTDLNLIRIVVGLPWYLDAAGRRVLGHLLAGRLKISGMFSHPILLTRLAKIMSVT